MEPLLHPTTKTALDRLVADPRGSYLFMGPSGIGRATAAIWVTARLNCPAGGDDCRNCRAILAGNHPDMIVVSPDKTSIGIAQIHQLKDDLALKPYYAKGLRVAVIDEADKLTTEAQNSLLKILEEPPDQTIFIMVAERADALLETVRSRLHPIHFAQPDGQSVVKLLVDRQGATGPQAASWAQMADGRPGLAILLASDEATRAEYDSLDQTGRQALEADMFDRLLLAQRIAGEDKADSWLNRLAGLLRQKLRQSTQSGTEMTHTLEQLKAVEQALKRLRANVNARAALEGLMLEL